MASDSTEPPRIEFPCADYPIKVFLQDQGAPEDAMAQVVQTVQRYAPDFDATRTRVRTSSGGRFRSVTVDITATGEAQLKGLHQALLDLPFVRLVL